MPLEHSSEPEVLESGMHIEDTVAEPAAPTERPLSAREIVMQNAVRRAHEQMESELAQSTIYDTDAKALGLVYPDENEPEAAPIVAVAPEVPAVPVQKTMPVSRDPVRAAPVEQVAAPVQSSGVHTILVDGREFAVTDQQYGELARLGMVANVALHQYQSQPAQPQYQAQQPQYQPEQRQQQQPDLIDPEQVKRVVRGIQFGNEDEAAAALAEYTTMVMSKAPPQQHIDTNAIVNRAVQESRNQAQLQQDTYTIQQEYSDIFANSQRTLLAKMNVDVIRARDMQMGRRQAGIDVYREAGNMVREAMVLPSPQQQQIQEQEPAQQVAAVVARQDVIERKREAPRRTQSIDVRVPAPQAQRAPTGSEIVDRMRAQRGQQSNR